MCATLPKQVLLSILNSARGGSSPGLSVPSNGEVTQAQESCCRASIELLSAVALPGDDMGCRSYCRLGAPSCWIMTPELDAADHCPD